MMQQPGLGTASVERHGERRERQVPIIDRADRPPDDEAGEEIEDRSRYSLPLSPILNSVVSPTQR
jgi:hypothetical protein